MAEETQQPDANQSDQAPAAPAGVSFDFSKSVPVSATPQPAGAPAGVTFDFSKSKSLGQPVRPPIGSQATGIGPRDTNIFQMNNAEAVGNWANDLIGDVKNGTDATWIGGLLRKMGAKGLDYGVTPGASEKSFGGPLVGLPTILHGITQLGEHPVRSVNEVASGVGLTAGPALVTQPEALPFIATGATAQKVGSAIAAAAGADEDTAELVGNVSGLLAGGASVKKSHIDAFETAVNNHISADAVYKTRVKEVGTAAEQATSARQAAEEAVARDAPQQEIIAAKDNASQAAANAGKAQEALKAAEAEKAATAVKVAQYHRDIQTAAKPKVKTPKVPKVATPEEIAKSNKDFSETIPSGPGKAAYTPEDQAAVRPLLENSHLTNAPVNSPEAVFDSMQSHQARIENELKPVIEKYADEPLKLSGDVPAEATHRYNPETKTIESVEPVSVKQKLVEALKEQEAVRPGFTNEALKVVDEFNLTDPSVAEADRIRKALNTDNRKKLAESHWNISDAVDSDPDFAARYNLADILRDGIYDRLIDKGVPNAREMRQLERSVISVRNAADRMIPKTDVKMRGTGEAGPVRTAAAWLAKKAGIGAGAAVGGATGIPGAAEVGAIGGGMAGEAVARRLAPGDLTRAQRIERSMAVRQTNAQVPHLDVSGAQPSNPLAFDLPPEVTPPMNPRENTQLHSDIATHYGEQMGETPYSELEDRFLSDVQIKKKFKVPLDPAERKLLQGINEAKVEEAKQARGESEAQLKAAEKQKADAEKAAKEAEKEKTEKEAAGLKTNLASPFETEPHLRPEDERALHHELGHHFQIAKAGHPTHDIIGRLHDQIDSGAEAEARWDPSALLDDRGKLDLGKLKDNIEDLMDIFHGGPVADEVINGTPVHKNAGAKSDLRRARTKLIEAGFAPTEASQLMAASEARVRKDFTSPGIRDIFQRYSQAREAGLDPGLLMSEETSGKAIQEFRDTLEGTNETTNEPTTPGKSGRSNPKSQPGGTSGVPGKRAGESGTASKTGEGAGGGGERGLETNLQTEPTYQVIDTQTGDVVSSGHKSRKLARRRADKLDLEYGGVRYGVKEQAPPIRGQVAEDLKTNKDINAPKITDIIPGLKNHPEIEQKIKDLGFENVLQKEWSRQHQTPKPDIIPETKINPGVTEKSTGSVEDDLAIKQGGGVPGGVMDFGEFGRVRMFHDPESGTTLAFKKDEAITPEAVKAKIEESKKQFEKR